MQALMHALFIWTLYNMAPVVYQKCCLLQSINYHVKLYGNVITRKTRQKTRSVINDTPTDMDQPIIIQSQHLASCLDKLHNAHTCAVVHAYIILYYICYLYYIMHIIYIIIYTHYHTFSIIYFLIEHKPTGVTLDVSTMVNFP